MRRSRFASVLHVPLFEPPPVVGPGDAALLRGLARAVADLHAERPLRPTEIVLCSPEVAPERAERADVASMLRGGGLSALARRVERLAVKPGDVAALVLADSATSLFVIPSAFIPKATAPERSEWPSWRAVS